MQVFRFAHERVLRLRKQHEKLAETRQYQCLAALTRLENEREELRRGLAALAEGMQQGWRQAVDVATWLSGYRRSERLSQALQQLDGKIQEAAREYQQACARRRQAGQDVETLESLKKRRWQAHQLARTRAEQVMLDELGLRRWLSEPAAEEEAS